MNFTTAQKTQLSPSHAAAISATLEQLIKASQQPTQPYIPFNELSPLAKAEYKDDIRLFHLETQQWQRHKRFIHRHALWLKKLELHQLNQHTKQ